MAVNQRAAMSGSVRDAQEGEIVDLCGGPGGWSEALTSLGLSDIGIDTSPAVMLTRAARGFRSLHENIARTDPRQFADVWGLIASPPCVAYSSAGLKNGQQGDTGPLVWEPLRWASVLRPEWIACEQVPAVLPIWRAYREPLETMGYRTWTGILCAADFGVPQERRRAVLMASRTRQPAPPRPTHAERGDDLFGELAPWVTMADALGLPRGCWYDSGQDSTMGGGEKERYTRSCDRPAGTVTGKTTSQWVLHDAAGVRLAKLRLEDACVLQGFPTDFPFQGTAAERLQQVGDAVPPPLARSIVATLTGVEHAGEVAA